MGILQLDDSEVAVGIGLDLRRLELTAVGEFDRDRVGPGDDVVVGEHEAVLVDDHA